MHCENAKKLQRRLKQSETLKILSFFFFQMETGMHEHVCVCSDQVLYVDQADL